MLTTTEILRKVKALEIKSKKLTSDLFTGEYHSAFKGRGMSFKEVRSITMEMIYDLLTGMCLPVLGIRTLRYLKKKGN